MADVRALLKSKRQEQHITHPCASYTQSGQLRCRACDMIVKHASAWNGHVGSKGHRTAVIKLKEEEALAALKRKKEEEPSTEDEDDLPTKKRKLDDGENDQPNTAGFPGNFFSDPTRTLPPQGDSDETDEENDENKAKPKVSSQRDGKAVVDGTKPGEPQSDIDREWLEFQASIVNSVEKEMDGREVFERATVFAEPELVDELPEGIPEFAIPKKTIAPDSKDQPKSGDQPRDEAEELSRRQEDEKELIMDRLLEEERLQEEADERVSVLKARLALVKQRRMLAKKSKQS